MKKVYLDSKTIGMLNPRFNANRYSAEDLEYEAGQLSNYGGGAPGYIGMGDDFLDFAGNAASFADAAREARPFIITLTNANAAARTALLCPGLIATQAGLVTDGAFNDKSGNAGLSGASGSPGSIAELNAFIRQFPSLVSGFKIASDSVAQMDQSITIVKKSPFKQHSSKVIATGTYASEGNFNTKILSIPAPFFMDSQTLIEYTVLGSTSVTLTLMFGTSLNIAKALRDKTAKAKQTIDAASAGARFIG